MQTVTFGTASAPFQAIRALHQVDNEIEEKLPKIANAIRTQFYVDDPLGSADSVSTVRYEFLQMEIKFTTTHGTLSNATARKRTRDCRCNMQSAWNSMATSIGHIHIQITITANHTSINKTESIKRSSITLKFKSDRQSRRIGLRLSTLKS